MIRITALALLFLVANCTFAFSEIDQPNNKQISFTFGTNYSYRKFNPPRWSKNYTDTSAINSINSQINNFNSYKAVLDSLDVPVIAKGFGVYIEKFFGKNQRFIFKTGLQYGIKDYTILPRYVYENTYPPRPPKLIGTVVLPLVGTPILLGVKVFEPKRKIQINISAGPVYNRYIGYLTFRTYKGQQKKFFYSYTTARGLGYEDFTTGPEKNIFFFMPSKLRWQGQLTANCKIGKNCYLGLLLWWEDTIFQRKNGGREFYRKESENRYTTKYRRRFYSRSANISIGWSF
jgi:hypothetical protein